MTNGTDGRKGNGQFGKGWKGGGGNSASIKRGLEMKDAFQNAITPEDMRKIAKRLLDIALHGEAKHAIAAAHELFNRLIGKPSELVASETQNHFGNILVTDATEALKRVEARWAEEKRTGKYDPMCGIKPLRDRNADG